TLQRFLSRKQIIYLQNITTLTISPFQGYKVKVAILPQGVALGYIISPFQGFKSFWGDYYRGLTPPGYAFFRPFGPDSRRDAGDTGNRMG
ncbi:MAG: hypothetical protein JXD22_03320, partial [Sedimentisphaerales bacterium]|nr:hypothetical protein [Sedimentisphaerales bacterium]